MRRSILLLALALLPSSSQAGYIQFNGDPSRLGSIHFGEFGDVSGSTPVRSMAGVLTPIHAGNTLLIADGVLTFALGPVTFATPDYSRIDYGVSGSYSLSGTLNGRSETFVSGLIFGGSLSRSSAGIYSPLSPLGFGTTARIAADVAAFYGTSNGTGDFSLSFANNPNLDFAVPGTAAALRANVGAVPGPRSLALLVAGLAACGGLRIGSGT